MEIQFWGSDSLRKKLIVVLGLTLGAVSALAVSYAMDSSPLSRNTLANTPELGSSNRAQNATFSNPVPAIYRQHPLRRFVYNSYQDFVVLVPGRSPEKFSSFAAAFPIATDTSGAVLIHDTRIIYSNGTPIKPASSILNVPLIPQLPQLPRGCEVTSLAMLLQFAGVPADKAGKMALAKEIKKDPTPYKKVNGTVYFGDPNVGFVGNMYDASKPGYGVYHKPIADLASTFFPHRTLDMSGSSFAAVKWALGEGHPVLVISNASFAPLPSSAFTTWQTPEGPVQITLDEHAVVITGYDQNYVYFNDPLQDEKNRKAPLSAFIAAWKQMGKQAVTILN